MFSEVTQIKTWVASNEIKDKRILLENRNAHIQNGEFRSCTEFESVLSEQVYLEQFVLSSCLT